MKKGNKKLKTIHIDDHQLFIDGIYSLLQSEPIIDWKGNAKNIADGLELFSRVKADLVILDYFLPDGTGLSMAKKILEINPETIILMVTMENSPFIIQECEKVGIKGYLNKTLGKNELLQSIQLAMDGKASFPSYLEEDIQQPEGLSKLRLLSKREKQVAKLITDGYTSPEISEKLYLSQFTVNTHRRNVLKKLGMSNTAQLSALISKIPDWEFE